MFFVPCDEGPNQILSIREADVVGRVGIGAEVQFGTGTVRWEGRAGPSSCGMNDEGLGSTPFWLECCSCCNHQPPHALVEH
jgi:hypothetical protein